MKNQEQIAVSCIRASLLTRSWIQLYFLYAVLGLGDTKENFKKSLVSDFKHLDFLALSTELIN